MNYTQYSRKVLRGHGSFLILLAGAMIVLSTIGTFLGTGPFEFLQPNPLAHVGLFQAYWLMLIVGVVLWMGSFDANPLRWDVIGVLAHLPPLAANFIFADTLATTGTPSTVPLHSGLILLELSVFAYYWYSRRNSPTPNGGSSSG